MLDLVFWCSGVLVFWCSGVLVFWCFGVGGLSVFWGAANGPFRPYGGSLFGKRPKK
jgi:hypothetical protein